MVVQSSHWEFEECCSFIAKKEVLIDLPTFKPHNLTDCIRAWVLWSREKLVWLITRTSSGTVHVIEKQTTKLRENGCLKISDSKKNLSLPPYSKESLSFSLTSAPCPISGVTWITSAVVRTHGIVAVSVRITVTIAGCTLVDILEKRKKRRWSLKIDELFC